MCSHTMHEELCKCMWVGLTLDTFTIIQNEDSLIHGSIRDYILDLVGMISKVDMWNNYEH